MPEALCQDFPCGFGMAACPDEFGKQTDGHVGLHVDVLLMFLSQDEFCVLRMCEDVVARFHKNRKATH